MSISSFEVENDSNVLPRKKKITGRLSDVGKKINLSSHEAGKDCKCFHFKCFEIINKTDRAKLLRYFNELKSHDEQNNYLAGLITILPVQNRRPRLGEGAAKRDSSFAYRVRIHDDVVNKPDVPVCAKAFCALHGITKNKLTYLQKGMKMTDQAPRDMRGKHSTLHRKLNEHTKRLICDHIKRFKGRKSHYSLKDSKKMYLPEDLNVKKMFTMFKQLHPTVVVSYETFRCILNSEFNISFGYPRTDTCTTCDEFLAQLKTLSPVTDDKEIQNLTTKNMLHKGKAETFYVRKKIARQEAKKTKKMAAVCMDFGKNVSLPNITTNDVYYKRQLSMYSFNIHILSSQQSIFYVYNESIAKKGANEVASFIFHFIMNYLDDDVEELQIFCDSAGGQNKNHTIFRFIHYIVNNQIHGLKNIKITFPVRGHSYLECDKNVGLWKLKEKMETPKDFKSMIKNSRIKPSPFVVVSVSKQIVFNWTHLLCTIYNVRKCPFKTQPIKEIIASSTEPRQLKWRDTYNGPMFSNVIKKPEKGLSKASTLKKGEFELPTRCYSGPLRISQAKHQDIMSLMKFCRPEAVEFFKKLKYQ
ncbi:hypothetical protein QTP88_001512 [Uroleucon formosanum]